VIDSKNKLSPLDQIWQTEAEVTRRAAAARDKAERTLAETQAQASQLKNRAIEEGRYQGQAQYKDVIAAAEEEARVIAVQANYEAEELRRKGNERMDRAVRLAMNIVIGLQGDAKFYER
jgi:vacuolar-type H+-ATPase subunit H